MDLGLKGRTAIVSGASSGLGLATAEALAAEGANVTMFARRRDVLQREADRIGALAVRGDVTNPRDLEAVVRQTIAAFGGIDILVWNSGGPPPGPGIGISPEALEEAVELLFFPALRLVDFCLPYLVQSPGGRILIFTSVAAKEPTDHLALSNAVRPGIHGWAKTLSRELGPRGVTVNCIAPGSIRHRAGADPEAEAPNIPMGYHGRPSDVAEMVAFLVSNAGRYMTGATLVLDGGLSRGLF